MGWGSNHAGACLSLTCMMLLVDGLKTKLTNDNLSKLIMDVHRLLWSMFKLQCFDD